MIEVSRAKSRSDLGGLEDMLREFLNWDICLLSQHAGEEIRAEDYLQNTLRDLDIYLSERGRIFLAREGEALAGCVFLKPLLPDTAEIKRMYVRPAYRGTGLGRRLLDDLMDAARELEYRQIVLDSTVYMQDAQALYRGAGFRDCDPYPEAETDDAYAAHMVYMRCDL